MREIKFRGKRITNGGWVYGYYSAIPSDEDGGVMHLILPFRGVVPVEVDQETVGQYTGLKDKNGVEVYEGDILLWENEFNGIKIHSLVTFKDGMYLADNAPLCDCLDEVVVGNKFQNPELLEERT